MNYRGGDDRINDRGGDDRINFDDVQDQTNPARVWRAYRDELNENNNRMEKQWRDNGQETQKNQRGKSRREGERNPEKRSRRHKDGGMRVAKSEKPSRSRQRNGSRPQLAMDNDDGGFIVEGAIPKDQTRLLGATMKRDPLKSIPQQFYRDASNDGGGGRGGGGIMTVNNGKNSREFRPYSRSKVDSGSSGSSQIRRWDSPKLLSAKDCSSTYYDVKIETIEEEEEEEEETKQDQDRVKEKTESRSSRSAAELPTPEEWRCGAIYHEKEGETSEVTLGESDYTSFMFGTGESDREDGITSGGNRGTRIEGVEDEAFLTRAYHD